MSEFQGMQRESAASENGAAKGPGFGLPVLSVPEQLQRLKLQDDISGMPLGQVVGLVRLAVAEAHVNATESEIRDEAERRWQAMREVASGEMIDPIAEGVVEPTAGDEYGVLGYDVDETRPGANVHGIGPDTDGGPNPDYDPAADPLEPIADRLGDLCAAQQFTAEMSLHMITERVREAALALPDRYELTEADIVAEAEAIWEGFSDNRKGPRVATVSPDGTVSDWRRPENTPDRGEGVGETHHTITDDEPQFSGAGAGGGRELSKLVPTDARFNGKSFIEPSELAALASDLIEERGYLAHLENCEIRYFWQRKTGTVDRQRVVSSMKRGSGHYGDLLDAEFAIFLAADTARERHHTDRHVARSLLRQLRRIGQDDKGNWIKLPFTLKLDVEDIREFADLNDEDLKVGRSAYRNAEQMGLFRDDDDDDEADDDGAGVLIHDDGTPLTAEEIEAQEAAELAGDDDDGEYAEDPEEDGEPPEDKMGNPPPDVPGDDDDSDILVDDPI